jgi:hypothetical protein
MVNESINLYTNVSGKRQTVYADWGNPTEVAVDGTVSLYESIGDALVDAGLFTLTTEDYATAVSERSPAEVDTAIDAIEDVIGTETDVQDLRSDLNDVIVSLIADETILDNFGLILTTDGIDNTMLDFGTTGNKVKGSDLLWDGGGGITYRLLLTGGTIVIESV